MAQAPGLANPTSPLGAPSSSVGVVPSTSWTIEKPDPRSSHHALVDASEFGLRRADGIGGLLKAGVPELVRVAFSELVELPKNLAEVVSSFGQIVDWDDTHYSLLSAWEVTLLPSDSAPI